MFKLFRHTLCTNTLKNKLSHINESGKASMVNITNKKSNIRMATARCYINVPSNVYKAVLNNNVIKGDVLSISRIAGITNSKKTSNIIPLCHPLNITNVNIDIISKKKNIFEVTSQVETVNNTGVEMEALVAVTTSALTFYDMCKSLSKNIIIKNIHLVKKTGGKSENNNEN